MVGAYLNLSDVQEIYIKVKGTRKGITVFSSDAKNISSKSKGGAYIFKDESALFDLCKKYLGNELNLKEIYSFGDLMQYIS